MVATDSDEYRKLLYSVRAPDHPIVEGLVERRSYQAVPYFLAQFIIDQERQISELRAHVTVLTEIVLRMDAAK